MIEPGVIVVLSNKKIEVLLRRTHLVVPRESYRSSCLWWFLVFVLGEEGMFLVPTNWQISTRRNYLNFFERRSITC